MKAKDVLMRKSVFFDIILCFAVFVLAFTVLMLCTSAVYSNKLKSNIVSQHTEAMKISSDIVDREIQKTLNVAEILSQKQSIYDIFYQNSNDIHTDVSEVQAVIEALRMFKNASDVIIEVAIVDRQNSVVYSNTGKFSFENYFGDAAGYAEYDIDFWKTKNISYMGYEVLNPSEHKIVSRSVMPLITSGFGGNKTGQLMIIDINMDMIARSFYSSEITEQSRIFIYNENQGIAFGDDEVTKGFFEDKKFVSKLNSHGSFTYSFGGEKYFIVKTNGRVGRNNDYFYVSAVPLDDLLAGFKNIVWATWLLNMCFMLVFIILAYYMSHHLYAPIRGLYSLVSEDSKSKIGKSNEIEYLQDKMQEMIDRASTMRSRIQTMLPLVCAQKLREFLDSMDDYDETGEIEHFLHQNGIDFEEDNFVVAIIKLKYSEKFYSDFNNEQYLEVRSGIGVLFETALGANYHVQVISDKKDEHILIINIPKDDGVFEDVIAELAATQESFKYDNDYLMINIAVGTAYAGYEGMKQSYSESRSISILQMGSGESRFDLHKPAQVSVQKYEYTMDDESHLFHCMIKGDVDGAQKIIRDIEQRNIANSIDNINVRVLYHQLYNTTLRVLQTKGVSERDLMQARYIDINAGFDSLDIDYMAEYICMLVCSAAEYTQIAATRIDIDGVIEYIDNNYTQDIYLENIAKEFNTTSKYLSKLLKQHLGLGFGAYLSGLRIEKAKTMLTETDMRINDIYAQCGFFSRNTFIRTFKNLVGVLPSDYRKMSKGYDSGLPPPRT